MGPIAEWLVAALGAVGIGSMYSYLSSRLSVDGQKFAVPVAAKAVAGGAVIAAVIELVARSVFLYVALITATLLFALQISLPNVQEFFSNYSALRYLIPWLTAAGVSGLQMRRPEGKTFGALALVICAFIVTVDVAHSNYRSLLDLLGVAPTTERTSWTIPVGSSVSLTTTPGEQVSFEVGQGAGVYLTTAESTGSFLGLFGSEPEKSIFTCSNPWRGIKAPTGGRYLVKPCGSTSVSVIITTKVWPF